MSSINVLKSQKAKPFELEDLIDQHDLISIITSFSTVTGLGSGVVKMRPEYENVVGLEPHIIEKKFGTVDLEKDRLTPVSGGSRFCEFIRKSEKGNLRCWWSDLRYCNEAFQKGHPVLYRCHCGLIDIVAPIRLGSWHVANVYVGQILSDLSDAELKKYFPIYLTKHLPLLKKLNHNLSRNEYDEINLELKLTEVDESISYQKFKKLVSELPFKDKTGIDEIVSSIKLLRHIADLISRRATTQAIMKVMQNIDQETGITLDIERGLSIFLENAKKLIRFSCSSLWLYNQDNEKLSLVVADLPAEIKNLNKNMTCEIGNDLLGKVIKTRKQLFFGNFEQLKDNLINPKCQLGIKDLQSRGAVPMLIGDRLIGIWAVGSELENAFNPDVINLMETFASHAALFVKTVRDRINIIDIMSQTGKNELLEAVVEKVPEMVNGKGCSIFLKNKDGDRAYLAKSRGLPPELVGKIFYEPGEGLTGWVLKHGKVLNISIHEDRATREKSVKSISTDLSWKSKYREFEDDSSDVAERPFLAAPLKTKDGHILGVIRISIRTKGGNFTAEDEALLKACAEQIVAALERPRITSDLKNRINELRLLSDISAEISQMEDLSTLLNKISAKAAKILQCGGITIWLHNPKKSRVDLFAGYGLHTKYIGKHYYNIGEGLTGRVAQTGKDVWISHAMGQPGWKGKYNFMISKGYRGRTPLIILPLGIKNEIIGVIKFTRVVGIPEENVENQKFSVDEYNLAWILSRQIAFVIKNTQMLEDLKNQIVKLENAQMEIVHGREKAWKEFSAITAHRMGTEVADLSGALYWLNQSITQVNESGKAADYLQRMDKTLNRMKKNVYEFTVFANPPVMKFEQVYINEIFEIIKNETGASIFSFKLDLDEDLPEITGDKENLIYAFRELCQNAEKALMSNGKITIKTSSEKASNKIKIDIMDNGQGIVSKYKKKIFEIGFRKSSGGTGLGLTIVKRYIEGHRGTIEEVGKECEGAHFIIKLPIKQKSIQKREI